MADRLLKNPDELAEALRARGLDAFARGSEVTVVHQALPGEPTSVYIDWRDQDAMAIFTVMLPLGKSGESRAELAQALNDTNARIGVRGFQLTKTVFFETHAFLDADRRLSEHVAWMTVGNTMKIVDRVLPELLARFRPGYLPNAASQANGAAVAETAVVPLRNASEGRPLRARSMDEIDVYLRRTACACGDVHPPEDLDVDDQPTRQLATFSGACPSCGRARSYSFELPARGSEPPGGAYGDDAPSSLLDAAEWLLLSDTAAEKVPGDPAKLSADGRLAARRDLMRALRTLDEVLKFIPEGAASVPDSGFFHQPATDLRGRDPGRFDRIRLEARRAAFHDIRKRYGF